MWQGALCRRGQVHAAFWGPDVFLDEKAVRACQLKLLSRWAASARVVYSGQTERYVLACKSIIHRGLFSNKVVEFIDL